MSFLDVIFYLGLGILALFAFQYAYRFHKVLHFDWRAWIASALSILLIVLSLAWAYASFLEHEIQAAWVGLFVFGGLGVVMIFLVRRFAKASSD